MGNNINGVPHDETNGAYLKHSDGRRTLKGEYEAEVFVKDIRCENPEAMVGQHKAADDFDVDFLDVAQTAVTGGCRFIYTVVSARAQRRIAV